MFFEKVAAEVAELEKESGIDYYPFGGQFNSYSRENSVKNKRLFNNGAEREDALELNVDGTKYRTYDYNTGRWWQIDPLCDEGNLVEWTPYNYSFNNPIRYNDPDGDCPFCPWLDAVVDVGFALYDAGEMAYDYATTGKVDPVSVAALTADLTAIAIPMTTGAGLAVRAAAKTVNAVDNAMDAKKVVNAVDNTTDAKKTYQTYTKPAKDPSTHGDYSGRTSGKGTPEENIAKRDANHHMNKTHGPAKLDKSSANKDAIRGREDQNIRKSGGAKSEGGTSGNAINGVSPNNPKKEIYKNAANKEFGTGN